MTTTDDDLMRVLVGGRSEDETDADVAWRETMFSKIDRLERKCDRLQRRADERAARTRRACIVTALIASVCTWGVTHAVAATKGGTAVTITNPCRSQHLHDCKTALRWWKHVAHKHETALAWQREQRLRLRDALAGRNARVLMGDTEAWDCIHSREAAWNDDGAPYWGGLQMDVSFMQTYGSDMIRKYGGYANLWTPRDQMIVAERAHKVRGYQPWPNTARACGYL